MSIHVLLNLSNELGKRDKMRGLPMMKGLNNTSMKKQMLKASNEKAAAGSSK